MEFDTAGQVSIIDCGVSYPTRAPDQSVTYC